ncbi:FMN-binding protein [Raineyella fluvialis]|nr:FMN-binding protein [Raineyella fluvialis]
MQVKTTITGGKITAITWVQLPSDGHSQRINSYAAPALVQEALQAQSANVDAVSGATYTSAGFQQSLQSALTKAGFNA